MSIIKIQVHKQSGTDRSSQTDKEQLLAILLIWTSGKMYTTDFCNCIQNKYDAYLFFQHKLYTMHTLNKNGYK